MKKVLALALAMLMLLSMTGCFMGPLATVLGKITETTEKVETEELVISASSSEETSTETSSAVEVEEEESSEAVVSEEEEEEVPFTPVEVNGEGSIYFTVDDEVLVEFSLPTETPIYSSINHTDWYLAMMTHSIMEGVSGRTIIELCSGTPTDYIEYYKSITSGAGDVTTVTTELDGREVVIYKSVEKVTNSMNREVYNIQYLVGVAVNETIVLGFRIDASHATDSSVVFDDSVIEILLNHCVFY